MLVAANMDGSLMVPLYVVGKYNIRTPDALSKPKRLMAMAIQEPKSQEIYSGHGWKSKTEITKRKKRKVVLIVNNCRTHLGFLVLRPLRSCACRFSLINSHHKHKEFSRYVCGHYISFQLSRSSIISTHFVPGSTVFQKF